MHKNDSSNKISVVINTYNATRLLPKVLEYVKGFDEVVICDMESTDDTLEIAKRYGARIVTFPKGNHTCPEPARTFAIQSATHRWVLVVDADEIIPEGLRQRLYEEIKRPNCPQGFYIPRLNQFMGKYSKDFNYDYQLRFFIKEGTVWPPYPHTFPKVQGKTERLLNIPRDAVMLHLANDSLYMSINKANGYTNAEVEKKKDKHYGLAALFYRPLWRFVRNYFLSGGYRMGIRGLLRAQLAAFYQWMIVAKMLEQRFNNESRQ